MWKKIKEKDPTYRRGYVIPVCIHCNVPIGLMHADQYAKGGDYVCSGCTTEPRRTFSNSDLQFVVDQFFKMVDHMIRQRTR